MDSLYMPHYVTETWIPDAGSGIPRRDKAEGPFQAYAPDHLASKAWTFSPELTSRAARIEREILRLNRHAASGQLESVAAYSCVLRRSPPHALKVLRPTSIRLSSRNSPKRRKSVVLRKARKRLPATSPFCVPLRKALPPNRQSLSSFSKSFEESGWGRRALFPLDFALFKTGPVEVTTHPLGPSSSQRPHA